MYSLDVFLRVKKLLGLLQSTLRTILNIKFGVHHGHFGACSI
jgi:hypothetical protein